MDEKKEEALKRSMAIAEGLKSPASPSSAAAAPPVPPGPANIARALSPSARRPAAKQTVIKDDFPCEVAFKVAFLGSGQGGSKMAAEHFKLGYRRVAVFNTTDMDFDGLPVEIPKLSLNVGGARKDAAFAKAQLKGREEEVWDLLIRAWGADVDYAIVCASLGGGTGSGTIAPLVGAARRYLEAHNLPQRVGALVSIPPVLEGQQQARNTVNAFGELLALKVSPLLIIDNAKIDQLYHPPMARLHHTANETAAVLFHLFNQLAAVHSKYITFDKSELGQLLDGGVVVMGVADVPDVNSPADISSRIRDELASNVLADVDLSRGKKGACIFVAHQSVLDTLPSEYFEAGFTQLDRIVGSAYNNEQVPTVIHRGLYEGRDPGLQCYTMISELDPPVKRLRELAKKAGLAAGAGSTVAKFLGLED